MYLKTKLKYYSTPHACHQRKGTAVVSACNNLTFCGLAGSLWLNEEPSHHMGKASVMMVYKATCKSHSGHIKRLVLATLLLHQGNQNELDYIWNHCETWSLVI